MTRQTLESTQKMYHVARFIYRKNQIGFELRCAFLLFLGANIFEPNGMHLKSPGPDEKEFL